MIIFESLAELGKDKRILITKSRSKYEPNVFMEFS